MGILNGKHHRKRRRKSTRNEDNSKEEEQVQNMSAYIWRLKGPKWSAKEEEKSPMAQYRVCTTFRHFLSTIY